MKTAPASPVTVSGADLSGTSSSPPIAAKTPRFGWLIGFVLPILLAVVWEGAVTLKWVNARLLPAPTQILAELADLARSGELFDHVGATLQRVGWGFVFGVAGGTLLGALSGYWTGLRRLIDPTLQALRSIPSIAWVPMFILWFGIFETSKIALIALGVFFPIYLALTAAVQNVDRKLVDVGRIFGFSHREMIARILLPATLPTYFVALRTGLGLGWMFVVAAEFMGAEKGLGFLLVDGEQTGRTTVILASLVVFAILGKITDWLIAAVSARMLRWQDSYKQASDRNASLKAAA